MAYIIVRICCGFLSLVIRLAAWAGVLLPLLYALIVPTLCHGWYESHLLLGQCIGWSLLFLSVGATVFRILRRLRT